MHSDMAIGLLADLLWTGLTISLPLMGLVMAIGIGIGILQVVTQVQEPTLTFVPKLVAAALALVVFGPWMLRVLTRFCIRLWTGIPGWV